MILLIIIVLSMQQSNRNPQHSGRAGDLDADGCRFVPPASTIVRYQYRPNPVLQVMENK